MGSTRRWIVPLWLLSAGWLPSAAWGQAEQAATVRRSHQVLAEMLTTPASDIPAAMLHDAHGVAIIPGVLKGSFIIGARHGEGVVLVRNPNGGWYAPVFISLTGGNVGWQVGIQSSDLLLVFKTRKSVDGLLSGKFTIGADAAAAAGPVGRQASAATDGRLQAEIYSYSRSRGLFAGVSLDGSVIQVDALANARYYRPLAPGQPAAVPPEAMQLAVAVAQLTAADPSAAAVAFVPHATVPAPTRPHDVAATVRDELARAAPSLYQLIDASWQNYLALPGEVYGGISHPSVQSVAECRERFDRVRSDPQYAALAERPEFQKVHGLLQRYAQSLIPSQATLSLPAPPAGSPVQR